MENEIVNEIKDDDAGDIEVAKVHVGPSNSDEKRDVEYALTDLTSENIRRLCYKASETRTKTKEYLNELCGSLYARSVDGFIKEVYEDALKLYAIHTDTVLNFKALADVPSGEGDEQA